MVKIGDIAPDFFLSDSNSRKHKLSDYLGHKVALYFYPKDDTPGCTKQACSLRDGLATLIHQNIMVLGISADDQQSHKKFSEKYKLPFTILCDSDKKVCKQYGVISSRWFIGKQLEGINRTTFLINEKGKIVKIIEKPNTDDHTTEILAGFESV
ncbi:MAG: thioredoxin-dependent thiol peroxidase [Candidatus Micrarchaeota archaeon]|nr:thioredoxin-dependent thiol peroxidase [Candidatus Micrarchaeota archaeon]